MGCGHDAGLLTRARGYGVSDPGHSGSRGGQRLALGGPSEQKVLAVLLLAANRVVSLASIVDTLWEDDPPATAAKQAQNAVSRLRRLLAAAGEPSSVVTDGAGYRISVPDGSLDAQIFAADVERARRRAEAGQRAQAAEILRRALALWRGPALAGLGGRIIQAGATAWDERRYAAAEDYYNQQALGRHREVHGECGADCASSPSAAAGWTAHDRLSARRQATRFLHRDSGPGWPRSWAWTRDPSCNACSSRC